jgi:hypothetical protein
MSKPTTRTNHWSSIGLSVDVLLSDLEQIVIDVPLWEWSGGKQTLIGTEKFLLESLSYHTDSDSGEFILQSIRGRGFRRDKKLKAREHWINNNWITQEVIDQIPVEYHNYAEKEFSYRIEEMEQDLQTYKTNGLVIKAKK